MEIRGGVNLCLPFLSKTPSRRFTRVYLVPVLDVIYFPRVLDESAQILERTAI